MLETYRHKAVTLLIWIGYEICPTTSTLWGFSTTHTLSIHGNILPLFSNTRWHNSAKHFIFITVIVSQSYPYVKQHFTKNNEAWR